jgi:hypothetical protein
MGLDWTGLAGGMTVAFCDMGCLRIDTHVHVPNRRQLSLVDITLHTDPPCLPFLRSLWTGLGGLASDNGSLQGLGCFCASFAFLCILLRCAGLLWRKCMLLPSDTPAGEILLVCHR